MTFWTPSTVLFEAFDTEGIGGVKAEKSHEKWFFSVSMAN
jgi:hypothetical protein